MRQLHSLSRLLTTQQTPPASWFIVVLLSCVWHDFYLHNNNNNNNNNKLTPFKLSPEVWFKKTTVLTQFMSVTDELMTVVIADIVHEYSASRGKQHYHKSLFVAHKSQLFMSAVIIWGSSALFHHVITTTLVSALFLLNVTEQPKHWCALKQLLTTHIPLPVLLYKWWTIYHLGHI